MNISDIKPLKDSESLFIAHAGIHLSSTLAGQNSIESIGMAVRAGFDFCEVDVRETSDGEPVLVHNETLNNTYRSASDYSVLSSDVYVKDLTLDALKSGYVLKADSEEFRVEAPTLREAAKYAVKNGIILMVHPKISRPDFLEKIMAICNEECGENGFYIVSEDAAVRYILSKYPDQCTMMVVKDEKMAKEFAQYPNCVLAVSWKHSDYTNLVKYCRSLGKHVETTLQNNVRSEHWADVINYDYLSPAKFEKYTVLETVTTKNSYTSDKFVEFGTAELVFKLKGSASVDCCGIHYDLESNGVEEFRIPVLVYNSTPSYSIKLSGSSSADNIMFKVAKH